MTVSHFSLPPDDDDDDDDDGEGHIFLHCGECESPMFTIEILEDGQRVVRCGFALCQAVVEITPPPS